MEMRTIYWGWGGDGYKIVYHAILYNKVYVPHLAVSTMELNELNLLNDAAGLSRIGKSRRTGQHVCRLYVRPWLPSWPVRTGQRKSYAVRI